MRAYTTKNVKDAQQSSRFYTQVTGRNSPNSTGKEDAEPLAQGAVEKGTIRILQWQKRVSHLHDKIGEVKLSHQLSWVPREEPLKTALLA